LQEARRKLFAEQPLCVECMKHGRWREATERDHIIPLAAGGRDDESNTQGLCKPCHRSKSHAENARGFRR